MAELMFLGWIVMIIALSQVAGKILASDVEKMSKKDSKVVSTWMRN